MNTPLRRELTASFDDVLSRLPVALKSEGFGVLTNIDMRETLKQKLGVEFRRYTIFGACNPPLAYQALQTQLEIGLMLPCNVIVYEVDPAHTVVCAIDPTQTLAATHDPNLSDLASVVRDKLARALSHLA
jgi:uncharacterized protein (DUF302 family)